MTSRPHADSLQARLVWALVAATVLTIIISVMLSPAQLSWMRNHWIFFNWPMLRIENLGMRTGLNIQHILMFLWLAFLLRLSWRKATWWEIALVLAALGVGTELLQVFLPGRDPRVSDVRDDMLGGFIGLLLAMVLVQILAGVTRIWSGPASSVGSDGRSGHAWEAGAWVLAILRGDADVVMPTGTLEYEDALQAARDEGVVSLVHDFLCTPELTDLAPEPLMALFTNASHHSAARSLWMLEECRRISETLSNAGIQSIWLKGAALSQWLYPHSHLRDLADIDLLLPDHATVLRVADLLTPLGYTLPNPHIAGDLVVHELLAWSERAKLELDLHWALSNDALFADRLGWDELRQDAIYLPGLGPSARGLAPMHALLHACMHRALNYLTGGENRLRWLYDIHLLALRLGDGEWARFADLARQRGLAGACRDALKTSSEAFHTVLPEPVMEALLTHARHERLQCNRLGSWGYLQWSTLLALPGWRARARWLRQLLFPDMAHLRVRYGVDGASALKICARRLLDGWRRWRGYVSG